MATAVEQIEPDGSIVTDFDPDKVLFADQAEIIRKGLVGRGWQVQFLQDDEAARRRRIRVSKGGVSFTAILYIFPNLGWSSNPRPHSEKRIQLSRPAAEHAADFVIDKGDDPRCALLGIYRRKDTIVICAWDAAAYAEHSNPSSCYVRTPAMSAAVRNGFGQALDGKRRLVCCFTPDMLAYYLENMKFLHETVVVSEELIQSDPEDTEDPETTGNDKQLPQSNFVPEDIPHNRIVYGAPGTGKSHRVEEDLKTYFPSSDLYERTTFYPDTTNGIFVGEYRPVPVYRRGSDNLIGADRKTLQDDLEPIIDYRFVPGPFLRTLVRAIKRPAHNFALVIEEINRAHASAVFGEIFQLLDRGDDGTGKFSVALTPAAEDYLLSQGLATPIRIPKNLYLWATMNSADQGVLPMDAAFRRRWSLEYVGIDEGEAAVEDWQISLKFRSTPMKWNVLRKAINEHLQKEGVAEDRLIGPFFMTQKELASGNAFENKLLQYLRDDVVRSAPSKLFSGESLTYGALVASYRSGRTIFVPGVNLGEEP